MKKKTLFVDDQEKVLQGLKRMLHGMRKEWDFSFAGSGQEALEIMEKERFDVIICEERMPKMGGLEILTEVMKKYPDVVRIILTGHSDEEIMLKSFYPAHQYLTKPCNADNLKTLLSRTCALRDLMSNDFLKSVVSKIGSLPSVPTLYTQLMEEVSSKEPEIGKIASIISQDVGMTAKVLQLVNSAIYGFRTRITTPQQAVGLMGLDTIHSLVLSVQVFSSFDLGNVDGFSMEQLWEHSLSTATMAKGVATEQGLAKAQVEDCYMASLLHDSGKLVLAANMPEEFKKALDIAEREHCPVYKAEMEVFGTTHAEVGAYLMGLWGLPDPIVEAIAFHHFPSVCLCDDFSALTATHVGDFIETYGLSDIEEPGPDVLDMAYLTRIGVEDKVAGWREKCLQLILQD